MNSKYCCVTNALAAFELPYIKHHYNEATKELRIILKVETDNDFVGLTTYVKHFSEAVTGRHGYSHRNQLISEVVIEDGNSHIKFNGCMLMSVNCQNYLNPSKVGSYEIEMSLMVDECATRLYLSGPMSLCKDEATWRTNFQKYEDIFTAKGYHVVNPAKNPILPTYEECLKHSLQQEMECDCVFFMPNSILSTGARLEYEIAKACGLEIVLLDDDISFTDNYANNSGIKCKSK